MHLLVYGPGRLGATVMTAAVAAGWPPPRSIGRPVGGPRPPAPLVDVVLDASRGDAVSDNLDHALRAGNRSFVLAATGWEADACAVRDRLLDASAAAVVAPNLSLGAGLFPPLEIAGIRAGAAPGTHLVTFDGGGESVELRLTARDRTAYAEGAIAAARWLRTAPRGAALHPFDAVVDDLFDASRVAVPA